MEQRIVSVVAMLCLCLALLPDTARAMDYMRQTEGKASGSAVDVPYGTLDYLTSGTGTVHSYQAQPLDNGYTRFTLQYTMPAGMRVNVFDAPNGAQFRYYAAEQTTGKKTTLTFDLKNAELMDAAEVIVGVHGDHGRYYAFFKMSELRQLLPDLDAAYVAAFAESEVTLTGASAPGNRTQETNSGDFVADAMRWLVMNKTEAPSVDADHVVAITNGGGIRAAIHAGGVSRRDIDAMLPFGDTVTVVYLTGAELLEALEAATYAAPITSGSYPQTAGIRFTLDTAKAYDANTTTYPDSVYYGPKSIQRVTINSVNGKAFSAADTYAVVTNSFCAGGGDTYYVFKNARQSDTYFRMDAAVSLYIREALSGVIPTEEYASVRGDQNILPVSAPLTSAVAAAGSGDTLTAIVTAPARSLLLAARFDADGRMTNVRAIAIGADCKNAKCVIPLGACTSYRLMLVDGKTFAPLCPAWSGKP